ncbi:hypothetical protein HAX54_053535 [Datura stramonium]|uniref:Uncharacterized protein n=1 Tax=Datura stramonium TaxID=4076 RepID=A0ABS8T0J8_DATST|nr:hypothetical protein [Datura stramonium]
MGEMRVKGRSVCCGDISPVSSDRRRRVRQMCEFHWTWVDSGSERWRVVRVYLVAGFGQTVVVSTGSEEEEKEGGDPKVMEGDGVVMCGWDCGVVVAGEEKEKKREGEAAVAFWNDGDEGEERKMKGGRRLVRGRGRKGIRRLGFCGEKEESGKMF